MKDEDFTPVMMLGKGDVKLALGDKYNPYGKHNENLKYYILVTSGYHVA
jgi:hypothetical protein